MFGPTMGLDEAWAPVDGGATQQGSRGESPVRWVWAGALAEAEQRLPYVEGPRMKGLGFALGATGWEVRQGPLVH